MSVAEPIHGSGATFDDIQKARAMRQELLKDINETTSITKRELNPMWARLTARALTPMEDTFGEEITAAMNPRGKGHGKQ
jgi:hypothetical protein